MLRRKDSTALQPERWHRRAVPAGGRKWWSRRAQGPLRLVLDSCLGSTSSKPTTILLMQESDAQRPHRQGSSATGCWDCNSVAECALSVPWVRAPALQIESKYMQQTAGLHPLPLTFTSVGTQRAPALCPPPTRLLMSPSKAMPCFQGLSGTVEVPGPFSHLPPPTSAWTTPCNSPMLGTVPTVTLSACLCYGTACGIG